MAAALVVRRFERNDGPAPFSDSIAMTQAEWDAMTPEEIEAEQQRRFDNWLAVITAPPPEPEE